MLNACGLDSGEQEDLVHMLYDSFGSSSWCQCPSFRLTDSGGWSLCWSSAGGSGSLLLILSSLSVPQKGSHGSQGNCLLSSNAEL